MAQARSDVQYAVKELCRAMSRPTVSDVVALKRLARYLTAHRRVRVHFRFQEAVKAVKVWTGTDYAGCRKTRKSTSGGVLMLGSHQVKGWSTTQGVIALSSGEAEYYGMVKRGSIGLGMRSM